MFRFVLIGIALVFGSAAVPTRVLADEVSVDIEGATPGLTPELFRSTLSSHGEWYPSARYGNVWRPRVAAGWRPYYYGAWLWTDEGWYWESSEPFAWAVYHYGRWVFDPAWGWVWVPGYQWAPAWVTWRFGVDVVGWAPLGPGVSVFVTTYPFHDHWWTFVPTVRFVGVPVYTVAHPRREIPRWFRSTSPAPPRAVPTRGDRSSPAPAWGGPSRRFVEERVGRPIAPERRAPAWRPEGRPEVRPGARPEGRPEMGPGARPEVRPEARPAPTRGDPRPPARAPAGERGERKRPKER